MLIVVCAAALMLGACGSDSQESSEGSSSTSLKTFAGAWGEEASGQPSLTIAEDGSFNGTDGCNSLVGHGTVDQKKFDFGNFATTLMACQDVDTWLSGANTATVDGDTLTVFNHAGDKIGTLEKR